MNGSKYERREADAEDRELQVDLSSTANPSPGYIVKSYLNQIKSN